jgi:hypothetical protein
MVQADAIQFKQRKQWFKLKYEIGFIVPLATANRPEIAKTS